MNIYEHDESFRKEGISVIAGIDEAGRGPIAGPVVAAAVILQKGTVFQGLRDSKKVPERERESLFWEILSTAESIGVGVSESGEIDRVNILRATKLAMARAAQDLCVNPDLLIIDAVTLPDVPFRQVSVVKADAKSAAVAAASIIAKYVRDRLMEHYHAQYPEYNFQKHKGYCTAEHVSLVNFYGPCPIHRKSFHQVVNIPLPF